MGRFADNLRALYETPAPRGGDDGRPAEVNAIIDARGAEGRTLLDEAEAKAVLAPTASRWRRRGSRAIADEAIAAARAIGFPVAVKLWSRVITHKTDVGGVKLGSPTTRRSAARSTTSGRRWSRRRGPESFLGVTVQPMVDRSAGHELILGARSIDSSVR
jgi:acetyltransferase